MLDSAPPVGSGSGVEKSITDPGYLRWCRVLRTLRERAGLTQAQLAERIGEKQKFVSTYETGQRRLDLIELEQILTALGPAAAPLTAWAAAGEALVEHFDLSN